MPNEPMTSAPMSSEPMPSEPMPSEPTQSRASSSGSGGLAAGLRPSSPPARDYFGADAELVLTALSRMVAAIRGERATLDRLQGALGGMAGAIAQAKTAMQPPASGPEGADIDVAALLDELEHRVDGMLEIVNGAVPAAARETAAAPMTAAPPPVEPDRVPTVSGVVSGLGRGQDAPAADDDTDAAANGADDENVPTVSMLEAMVEALNASVPATAPEGESAPQAAEAAPPAVEAPSETMEATLEAAAPLSFLGDPIMPESELLAGFAELASMPIPPPEVGAVVIFTSAAEPAAAPAAAELPIQQQEPPPAPAAERLPQPLPMLDLPEMVPARFLAAAPADEPEALAPAAKTEAASAPAGAGFDPAAGLAQELANPPAPEPHLLEEPEPAVALPLETEAAVPAAEPSQPAQPPAAKPAASDPLAPLKAMSPAEKIALFS